MNVAVFADRAMERFGDYDSVVGVSLSGPDTTHSSGDLHRTSLRLSSALQRLGVQPGERVVVMIPNAPEITALYAAIARCGAVVLPMPFLLADGEVRRLLADAEPVVVITSAELYGKVSPAASQVQSVRSVICIDRPTPDGAIDLEELLAGERAEAELVDRDQSDLALLIYTGGTTGRPKGVMLTHGNLAFAAERAAEVSAHENDVSHTDITCSALPLSHTYGVLVWLAGTQLGGRSVLMRWFEPGTWFRCVEEYRCTISPLVPTMISYLLNHADAATRDMASLRLVNTGAAPLPADVGRAFEERFGCTVLEGWGLTESVGYGTLNRLGSRKWGSIGRPGPGVEICVHDVSSWAELPAGEVGEICMRGGHTMAGYWNLPDRTAETLRDGWLRTGDVGYVDADGFVFVVDRTEDLIVRGGLNIYPRDVEEVLQTHPAVLEAAVVGVPDHRSREQIKAYVVLKSGAEATSDEILEHCRTHLAGYKAPRSVTFLDALPKSGVGKVLRRELRNGAAASQA